MSYSTLVDEIQAELDAAKPPPTSLPTGELQAELERLQGCNERAKKQVEVKKKWLAEKTTEVRKQCLALCEANFERYWEIEEFTATIAERVSASQAEQAAAVHGSTVVSAAQLSVTQLPAFFEITKEKFDQRSAANQKHLIRSCQGHAARDCENVACLSRIRSIALQI